MKKSLIALAFGTLGLGIAEFVMMGILPDVAKDLGISIPVAGHFISAYALGVCVGAPVLTLARKYPLKHILLVLVTLIMIGNICAALSPNYWVLLHTFHLRTSSWSLLRCRLYFPSDWLIKEKVRKLFRL